jgi:hypothetical protein
MRIKNRVFIYIAFLAFATVSIFAFTQKENNFGRKIYKLYGRYKKARPKLYGKDDKQQISKASRI